jgi:hypothetical protein
MEHLHFQALECPTETSDATVAVAPDLKTRKSCLCVGRRSLPVGVLLPAFGVDLPMAELAGEERLLKPALILGLQTGRGAPALSRDLNIFFPFT